MLKYLLDHELPATPSEAKRVKTSTTRFTVIGQELYKRGYSAPLLKCLGPQEAEQAMEEVHEGDYGEHLGGRMLAGKILWALFFQPTLGKDAARKVQTCNRCQKHAPLIIRPPSWIQPIFQPSPFAQWRLDILGLFPMAQAQRKFLLVATDYFTKWVEPEPLATITEKKVEGMVWKDIICRFSIPKTQH